MDKPPRFVSLMPLEDGRPRLKLSYNSAPFVLGNPLPPCKALEDDSGLLLGDATLEAELAFNDALGLAEQLDKDWEFDGDVLIALPKEEVLAYIFEADLF